MVPCRIEIIREKFPAAMKRKGPMWSKKLISSIHFFKKSIDKN